MNEDDLELAKAAAEGTAAGLTRSLHDIIANLLGPWSHEVGEEWGDVARQWRQRRADRVARRTIELLEEWPSARRPIHPKILLPAFGHASFEDDDALQERWAALIANAATAGLPEITRDFVEILKELTPRDAKLLEWIRDHPPELDGNDPSAVKEGQFVGPDREFIRPRVERRTVVEKFGLPDDDFELLASRLERLGLCDVGRFVFPTRLNSSATGPRKYDSIQLRPLAVALVDACRREKPSGDDEK